MMKKSNEREIYELVIAFAHTEDTTKKEDILNKLDSILGDQSNPSTDTRFGRSILSLPDVIPNIRAETLELFYKHGFDHEKCGERFDVEWFHYAFNRDSVSIQPDPKVMDVIMKHDKDQDKYGKVLTRISDTSPEMMEHVLKHCSDTTDFNQAYSRYISSSRTITKRILNLFAEKNVDLTTPKLFEMTTIKKPVAILYATGKHPTMAGMMTLKEMGVNLAAQDSMGQSFAEYIVSYPNFAQSDNEDFDNKMDLLQYAFKNHFIKEKNEPAVFSLVRRNLCSYKEERKDMSARFQNMMHALKVAGADFDAKDNNGNALTHIMAEYPLAIANLPGLSHYFEAHQNEKNKQNETPAESLLSHLESAMNFVDEKQKGIRLDVFNAIRKNGYPIDMNKALILDAVNMVKDQNRYDDEYSYEYEQDVMDSFKELDPDVVLNMDGICAAITLGAHSKDIAHQVFRNNPDKEFVREFSKLYAYIHNEEDVDIKQEFYNYDIDIDEELSKAKFGETIEFVEGLMEKHDFLMSYEFTDNIWVKGDMEDKLQNLIQDYQAQHYNYDMEQDL